MSSTATPNLFAGALSFLRGLMNPDAAQVAEATPAVEARPQMRQPVYSESSERPKLLTIKQPDGRISQYPPSDHWDDWVEYDSKSWPQRSPAATRWSRRSASTARAPAGCSPTWTRRPSRSASSRATRHPGSRGRNCAKGPATHNQIYDPERILYPLKRVGERGEGKWKRVSWEEALTGHRRQDAPAAPSGATASCTTSAAPAKTTTPTAASRPGASTATTATPTSARRRAGGYYDVVRRRPPEPGPRQRPAIVLLISSHLETGHYFNPHAQRIIEGKAKGAKIITFDPRLSNTAARSDVWLPTWPGSETDGAAGDGQLPDPERPLRQGVRPALGQLGDVPRGGAGSRINAEVLEIPSRPRLATRDHLRGLRAVLLALYAEFTFERAAEESQVDAERIIEAAEHVARARSRRRTHLALGATIGNLGGWQVARTSSSSTCSRAASAPRAAPR
jgi:anaerobic selenocysteine-containing dehydrogenase